MNELIYLISGTLILLVVMYDFFFTTLSGSRAAFITRFIYFISHKILHVSVKVFGRSVYRFSGMMVNLMVLSGWVILVWTGLFLVYSYHPEALTNSEGEIASASDRLYFTGYTLSTLGVGDFSPDSPFFEILTSVFSFFGFIFFTASMTYLISVSSAIIQKRSLALSIRNLGNNPDQMVENLLNKNTGYCYTKFSSLQEMLDKHTVQHESYPVLHFYGNAEVSSSLSINIAVLDEAISKLLSSERGEKLHAELMPLRSSITHFLTHMQENYSRTINLYELSNADLPDIGKMLTDNPDSHLTLDERRSIIGGLLKNESFDWADVYYKKD